MNAKHLCVVMSIVLLGLAGCSQTSAVRPSAQPIIKPPPSESITWIAGARFMDLFGALTLAIVVGVGIVVGLSVLNYLYGKGKGDQHARLPSWGKTIGLSAAIATIVLALQAIPVAAVTVPSDQIGLKLRFEAATNEVAEPGLHVLVPWVQQIALVSQREFTYITTGLADKASEDFPDYPVGARTCDGVEVQIPYTIKFQVNPSPETLPSFYRQYGSIVAAEERVVKVESRQIVRAVPTGFSSSAMYASTAILQDPSIITDPQLRALMTKSACGAKDVGFETLNEQIRQQLEERFRLAGLRLTFFGIRQPDLGEFGKKIDAVRLAAKDVEIAQIAVASADANKQIKIKEAEAAAESAKIQTVSQAEADAQAAIKRGEGEAQVKVAIAKAEADALKHRSEAEAEANHKIAQSLTPDLVAYQVQMKLYSTWNGQLPSYSGGGAIPFLQLPEAVVGSK